MIDTLPTRPLREEHRELLPRIERMKTVAGAIGKGPADAVLSELIEVHEFLTKHLIPHALAEDEVLYPAVAKLMGAPKATATMHRDHVEVLMLATRLEQLLHEPDDEELRAILYGLYELVKTHFAKEEEIYLPLLDDRLTAAEAEALFSAMERAATRIKAEA